jgi:hypothetical protein
VRGKLSENLLHRSPNYTRKTLRYIQVPSQFSIHMSCSTALLWKKLGLRFFVSSRGGDLMSQSMIEFIQDIEKDRDANDIKVRQLERITGIDRCTIEDGLSGKTKEMKLENFISIVNVIYKEVSIRPKPSIA